MFFVPIPEPELNRFSRRIRTALLDIVDALAPMDINCNYKCIFLRNVDNANHGTCNPEANYLACMHITANIICILKLILSLIEISTHYGRRWRRRSPFGGFGRLLPIRSSIANTIIPLAWMEIQYVWSFMWSTQTPCV